METGEYMNMEMGEEMETEKYGNGSEYGCGNGYGKRKMRLQT